MVALSWDLRVTNSWVFFCSLTMEISGAFQMDKEAEMRWPSHTYAFFLLFSATKTVQLFYYDTDFMI